MENICRSCLKVDQQMKNIFSDDDGSLIQMIKDCTSIRVTATDGLPNSLCIECEDKLQSAHNFRELFKNNDQALRSHLNVTIKKDQDEEDDADMFDQASQDGDVDGGGPENEDTKPAKYKCNKCPKFFTSARALGAHRQRGHSEDEDDDSDFDAVAFIAKNKTYQCSHCEMKFSRQHLLLKHQREDHLEITLKENIKTELQELEDDEDEDEEDDEEDDDIDEDALEDDLEKDGEVKEYPCELCEKVLKSKSGLNLHLKRHTKKKSYVCNICDSTFIKISDLKKHMTVAHGMDASSEDYKVSHKKREMQCEFCDRKFKYKKSFTQHMRIEHGIDVDENDLVVAPVVKRRRRTMNDSRSGADDDNEDFDDDMDESGKSRTYACHVCGAEFNRSNHLSKHMIIHRDVLTHKCDKCEEAFMSDDLLQKHLLQHVDKPYNCFACSKTFVRGEHYIRHIRTHDIEDSKILQCPICSEDHEGIEILASHVKSHLSKEKRHTCMQCGKAFIRADNLKTHMKVHTGAKDIPKLHLCIYCGKEFNNSSNMIVHMRRHTGERPYKCKQCGKGFPRSHDLKCHERTHSGEKPYLCTLCGKSFNKSNKLLRHTRVHTGERPYVCSICGRGFTQSNDLALHMRRHTGARPYACGVCSARFIQSGQLKAHQRAKGHWIETAPDLKGSYRVEPVISCGESKPIRFRRNAAGEKYQPPQFDEKNPPPLAANNTEHKLITEPPHIQQPQIVNTQNVITNVAINPNQTKVLLLQAYEPYSEGYVAGTVLKVQNDTLDVVHATGATFQDDSQGTDSNATTFTSTEAGSYECRTCL